MGGDGGFVDPHTSLQRRRWWSTAGGVEPPLTVESQSGLPVEAVVQCPGSQCCEEQQQRLQRSHGAAAAEVVGATGPLSGLKHAW